jgi:hypothetical protein
MSLKTDIANQLALSMRWASSRDPGTAPNLLSSIGMAMEGWAQRATDEETLALIIQLNQKYGV